MSKDQYTFDDPVTRYERIAPPEQRQSEPGGCVQNAEHRGRTGHVFVHADHAVGSLEVVAAGIKTDAFAD